MKKYIINILIYALFFVGFSSFSAQIPKEEKEVKTHLNKKYLEAVKKLEHSIIENKEILIESAAKDLLKLSKSKENEIVAHSCYIYAVYYLKLIKKDYEGAQSFLIKAYNYASSDSKILYVIKEESKRLRAYLNQIDMLLMTGEYRKVMQAASMYSSKYLRNYGKALNIYNGLVAEYPLMAKEVSWAKATLYLYNDPEIRDEEKAEKELLQIVKYYKDFKLYADAAYKLAELKIKRFNASKLNEKQKRVEIKAIVDLLKISEKNYTEKVSKKEREPDPEFYQMIKVELKKFQSVSSSKFSYNKRR